MSRYCPTIGKKVVYLECNECTERSYEKKTENIFRLLVCGSRDFEDYDLLKSKLDHYLSRHRLVEIVSGGCKGADKLAERYAKEKGFAFREFPANWNKYKRAAGPIRNEEMHKYISQFENRGVVAFWNGQSAGTRGNFELAHKYNNPLRICKTKEEIS